jgi:hypothetical protein
MVILVASYQVFAREGVRAYESYGRRTTHTDEYRHRMCQRHYMTDEYRHRMCQRHGMTTTQSWVSPGSGFPSQYSGSPDGYVLYLMTLDDPGFYALWVSFSQLIYFIFVKLHTTRYYTLIHYNHYVKGTVLFN